MRATTVSAPRQAFWCPVAWLPDGPAERVRVQTEGGVITDVVLGVPAAAGDLVLAGVVLPGLANAHSHAFHRALRGRTHGGTGSFWTWRQQMYALAGALDPDSYYRLARAVYAEMVLAGVTAVGEFHYLHHAPGGRPYDDPNAMGTALRRAAADAGIRLSLLDACYLTGGLGEPLAGPQLRFGDSTAEAWAKRVDLLAPDEHFRVGAAIHSVRAVPRDSLGTVAGWARSVSAPLHVHLSEQQAENAACQAAHGISPTALLDDAGALGPGTTVVHAVHVSDADVATLGRRGVSVCLCPSTEQDLADGLAPGGALAHVGASMCLGSDQHAQTDLLAEGRLMEMHERLATSRRGTFSPADVVEALTWRGHAAIGWPEAGRLHRGAVADLVAVRDDTVRTAGALPDQLPLVASAADVDVVVCGGRVVVDGGQHVMGDVPTLLRSAVADVWADAEGAR